MSFTSVSNRLPLWCHQAYLCTYIYNTAFKPPLDALRTSSRKNRKRIHFHDEIAQIFITSTRLNKIKSESSNYKTSKIQTTTRVEDKKRFLAMIQKLLNYQIDSRERKNTRDSGEVP